MKDGNLWIRSLLLLLLPAGCVTPFYPPEGSGLGGHLVIDGSINATKQSATISLSRSLQISDYHPAPAESDAQVTIASSTGEQYQLTETKEGKYEVTGMSIDESARYTLHVVTQLGESYSSDEIGILAAPTIDSISWAPAPSSTGVNFYVSGHSSEKNTGYYRWTFDETFQYNVPVFSDYKKDENHLPVFRNPEDWVYTCWASFPSTDVLIGSTKAFSSDAVSMFKINFLPRGSRKLSHVYRMTVQQRAITEAEFNFWDQIKKTTETVGGLFDPIPGSVTGNIHSDKNDEVVLGYFSGGFVAEKIKYLGSYQLPPDLSFVDPFNFDCTGRILLLGALNEIKPTEVWVQTVGTPVIGYFAVPENCADCKSIYNGSNVKPDDWPLF